MPSQLITASEVARILTRPKRTVDEQAKRGSLPYVAKLDGRTGAYLFDRDVIVALAGEVAA